MLIVTLYNVFSLILSEQREERQSSIQSRLVSYVTCPYFKDPIFNFLTSKISMLKLQVWEDFRSKDTD